MYQAIHNSLTLDTWVDETFHSDVTTRAVMIAYLDDDDSLVVVPGCWTTDPAHPHHHEGGAA